MPRRPGRQYTRSGRLIKIDPQKAKPCQLMYNPDWIPAGFNGEPFPDQTLPITFASRKSARKLLNKLIKWLPKHEDPNYPRTLVIQNL